MNNVVEKFKAFHHPFPSDNGVTRIVYHRLWMVVGNAMPDVLIGESINVRYNVSFYIDKHIRFKTDKLPKNIFEAAWMKL